MEIQELSNLGFTFTEILTHKKMQYAGAITSGTTYPSNATIGGLYVVTDNLTLNNISYSRGDFAFYEGGSPFSGWTRIPSSLFPILATEIVFDNTDVTYGDGTTPVLSTTVQEALENLFEHKADLGVDGKIPESQLPDSVLGAMKYQGPWDVSIPGQTLPDDTTVGHYYVVTNGPATIDGIYYTTGDLIIREESGWSHIQGGTSSVDAIEVGSSLLQGVVTLEATEPLTVTASEGTVTFGINVATSTEVGVLSAGDGLTISPEGSLSVSPGNGLEIDENHKLGITKGSANQILGTAATGGDQEYKSLLGTTNQVNVTHATGTITLSLPQSIATISSPQFARLGLGVAADATKNLYLNAGTILTNVQDGAAAIGFTLTTPAYTIAGAKLLSLVNNTSEKFYVNKDGVVYSGGFTDTNVVTPVFLGSSTDTSLTTTKKDILGGINELNVTKANVNQSIPQSLVGWGRGTRLITGGHVTQNSTTSIDISAGSGVLYDSSTQTDTFISWDTITNFSLAANIAAGADASYILIGTGGVPTAITTEPLNAAIRNGIYVGKVSHRSGGMITAIRDMDLYGEEAVISINELSNAIGPINISGNVFSAYSTDLRIQKSLGVAFRFSINTDIDRKSPSFVTDAALSPVTFNYCQRKTGGGVLFTPSQTVIIPGMYDTGNSTLSSVANNKFTVQRIYYFPRTNSIYIFYGRYIYGSKGEAEAGLGVEEFTTDSSFFDGAILRAYLIVKGSATNLASTTDAEFIACGKFAGAGVGGGSASAVTFQNAYDNSTKPQLVTNSLTDGVQFKRGSAADTDNVLEVLNGSDASTFSVLGTGLTSALDFKIPAQSLGTPTYSTIGDFCNSFGATGRKTGGIITDAGGSYISITGGTGFIKATDSDEAQLMFFDWPAPSNILIPSNSVRYIGVEYNSGVPRVVARTSWNWDLDSEFSLGRVVNEPINGVDTLHIINNPWWVTDGITNVIERLRGFGRILRDENLGGFSISVTGTRSLAITGGTLWSNVNEFPITGIDTNVSGTFEYYWYKAGTGWQDSDVTQYSVLQWNDITQTTLQNIGVNKYCNLWIYAEADDEEFAILYPQAQYNTAAEAEAATGPLTIPAHIQNNGILIGKVIFRQNTNTPVGIYSAFTTRFTSALVTNHANLASLAWGSSGHTGTANGIAGFNGSGLAIEYTSTGSGTVVAFATSPTLTTPIVTTSLLPSSNDGAVLGNSSYQFSDLYLAEGGMINWNNGIAILTQAGDLLTLSSADFTVEGIITAESYKTASWEIKQDIVSSSLKFIYG